MVLYQIFDIDIRFLKFNILVPSEDIFTLQKFLFSDTFLCNSSFFSVAKE